METKCLPTLIISLLAASVAGAEPALALSAATVSDLRCEDLVAPAGVEKLPPQLSWRMVDDNATGQRQTAYQIMVASKPALLAENQGDIWDSGKVVSDESQRLPFGGPALKSRDTCYWKVRAWDKDGQPTAWSAPSEWRMGLLQPEDWTAKWIVHPSTNAISYPWLRQTF
jgi:alpha-L-rhamnosidase